ncbi:MAG: hypothetical protein WDM91_16760 [Rhizomicrobium sp.]
MSFVKSAVSVAALSLMLGVSASAQSDEPASVIGCLHMQKKVNAALDANPSSPNASAARAQAQGAQGYCTHGLYKTGLTSYAKALEMLASN